MWSQPPPSLLLSSFKSRQQQQQQQEQYRNNNKNNKNNKKNKNISSNNNNNNKKRKQIIIILFLFLLSILVAIVQCFKVNRIILPLLSFYQSVVEGNEYDIHTNQNNNNNNDDDDDNDKKKQKRRRETMESFSNDNQHQNQQIQQQQQNQPPNEDSINNNDTTNTNNNSNNNINEIKTNEEEEKKKKKKLIAIIHVGPHKTGSTAIQSALFRSNKYKTILQEQDEFVLFPFHYNSGDCFFPKIATTTSTSTSTTTSTTTSNKCSSRVPFQKVQDMKQAIQQAIQEEKHIMYSSEALEYTEQYNLTTLQKNFLPHHYKIYISIVYRRYYQWIVSVHGQLYRENANWDEWPTLPSTTSIETTTTTTTTTTQSLVPQPHKVKPLVSWLTMDKVNNFVQQRYTGKLYNTYSYYFPNTTYLINYHDNNNYHNINNINNNDYVINNTNTNATTSNNNDIVTKFACHPNTHTPHFCAAKLQEAQEKEHFHQSSTISTTRRTMVHDDDNNLLLPSNIGELTIHDEILMTAYTQGILSKDITTLMSRKDARRLVQEYIETNIFLLPNHHDNYTSIKDNNTNNNDKDNNDDTYHQQQQSSSSLSSSPSSLSWTFWLPHICIEESLKTRLLDISLYVEQVLFPDFFQTIHGEQDLRLDFKQQFFCSVDTTTITTTMTTTSLSTSTTTTMLLLWEKYPKLVEFLKNLHLMHVR